MKKNIYFVFIYLTTLTYAQQSSQFTHSADFFSLDNPAGLSIEEMRYKGTVVNLLVRNQWWDFNTSGYPQTQILTWLNNYPENHLIGAAVVVDKIGETRQTGLSGRYAHRLANGLKLGVSAGMVRQRIFTGKLDQFDPNDPLAATAGDPRWRLMTGAGMFYSNYRHNAAWNWFAGLSFRRVIFMNKTEGSDTPPMTDVLAQGGIGQGTLWAGGRLRLSFNQPSALDVYVRNYFLNDRIFLGGMATSDADHHTLGIQAGYQHLLASAGQWNNHYLTISTGFSKPLSKYVQGGNLIFDFRATWSWQRRPS